MSWYRIVQLVTAAAVLARPGLAQTTATDTTFAVDPGGHLDANGFEYASVTIRGWDRDSIRIRATHASAIRLEIKSNRRVVELREHRPPMAAMERVTLELTVPRAMTLEVIANELDLSASGSRSSVAVSTNGGSIHLHDIDGAITARGTQVTVQLDSTRGNAGLRTTNGTITVTNHTGDLTAETVAGDVRAEGIDAGRVTLTSHAGAVEYQGTIKPQGLYQFGSQRGDLTLYLPSTAGATISTGSVRGRVEVSGPASVTVPEPGKRGTIILGDGSAQLEAVTFSGRIHIIVAP